MTWRTSLRFALASAITATVVGAFWFVAAPDVAPASPEAAPAPSAPDAPAAPEITLPPRAAAPNPPPAADDPPTAPRLSTTATANERAVIRAVPTDPAGTGSTRVLGATGAGTDPATPGPEEAGPPPPTHGPIDRLGPEPGGLLGDPVAEATVPPTTTPTKADHPPPTTTTTALSSVPVDRLRPTAPGDDGGGPPPSTGTGGEATSPTEPLTAHSAPGADARSQDDGTVTGGGEPVGPMIGIPTTAVHPDDDASSTDTGSTTDVDADTDTSTDADADPATIDDRADEALRTDEPVPETPVRIRVEAESGALLGTAAARSDHAGHSGAGFVGDLYTAGSGVEVEVEASTAGPTPFTVRYAAGNNGPADVRTLSVLVNGAEAGTARMAVTDDWSDWDVVVGELDLVEGTNTVTLKWSGDDTGWVNIDYLQIN